ncbi:hypothetical protein PIIN_07468 [Serendipita indica DSM 11827]|uniref:F-box domain-containing protein n=1 Tax=Serendipita indica (strain DSM 11827) TaxID=1109443 RepID=G4TQC2_SERID|nr:hypothetical protein PIIN_07468 [Serendipita indica DSM 11827]
MARLACSSYLRLDPLSYFPSEISVVILQQATLVREEWFHYQSFKLVNRLTCVSQRWKLVIESIPLLWTSIELVGDAYHYTNSCVLKCSAFSRQAPLSVDFRNYGGELPWDAVQALLMKAHDRIHQLRWDSVISNHNTRENLKRVDRIFQKLPMLPELRYTGNRANRYEWGSIADIRKLVFSGRKLKVIEMALGEEDFRMLTCWTLEKVSVRASLNIAMPYLEKMTQLEDVEVLRGGFPFQSTSTQLLPWTTLSLRKSYDCDPPRTLLERTTTQLVNLSVKVTPSYLYEFLRSIYCWPRLVQVWFTIDGGNKGVYVSNQRVIANHSIRHLSLFRIKCSQLNGLGHLLHRVTPDITELFISRARREELFETLATTGFTQLETLRLRLRTEYTQDETQLALCVNSLSTLTVDNYSKTPKIRPRSPSVTHLTLIDHLSHARSGTVLFTDWPQLVSLVIKSSFAPVDQSFTHLMHIAFKGGHGDDLTADVGGGTRFCWELATNPPNLPRLAEVDFGSLPEWDIFFIMLRRRNQFPTNNGISKIAVVRLRPTYPKWIASLILGLLDGKPMDLPPYKRLSWAEDIDSVLDLNR